MAQEIESRDGEWFRTGVVPSPDAGKVRAGAKRVVFDSRKLTHYSLNSERQPDKARAWLGYLGYTADDSAEVMDRVYEYMADHEPRFRNTDTHGDHFTADMTMAGKDGRRAKDRIGLVIDPGANKMRLVTIYVNE